MSFAAHVDFNQNYDFITKVRPGHVVLVHGEQFEMGRLKERLKLEFNKWPEHERPRIENPPNVREVVDKKTRRAKLEGAGKEITGDAGWCSAVWCMAEIPFHAPGPSLIP